ncbi:MAG: RNA polymerase factor sigma-54 [Victivallaceae bacterium]
MLYDHLKSSQILLTSASVQQGLAFLQMPIIDLLQAVREEVILNPIFDISSTEEMDNYFNDDSFSRYSRQDNRWENVPEYSSPLSDIYRQMCFMTANRRKRYIVDSILGSLDNDGFLRVDIQELSLLTESPIQEIETILQLIREKCEPLGIGSRNLKEYLLVQLKHERNNPRGYQLIQDHFNDLTDNKLERIASKIHLPKEKLIAEFQKTLTGLRFTPLSCTEPFSQRMLPDAFVYKKSENDWLIKINDDNLEKLRINKDYLKNGNIYSETSKENSVYFKKHIASAQHLIRNLNKRTETLLQVLEVIVQKQDDFFNGKRSTPLPLSVKTISEILNRHESTIFRAVKNKTISTPIGIFSLQSLLPRSFPNTHQDMGTSVIKNLLHELIRNEKHPMSDEELVRELLFRGIKCARRTITKYRRSLNIPGSTLRIYKPKTK